MYTWTACKVSVDSQDNKIFLKQLSKTGTTEYYLKKLANGDYQTVQASDSELANNSQFYFFWNNKGGNHHQLRSVYDDQCLQMDKTNNQGFVKGASCNSSD
eukprot:Pgem_evm1s7836